MLVQGLAVIAGLLLTIWAADRFVEGAAACARRLGIRPLVVGLTVMALGTSAPELATAGLAAAQGYPGLGIGNALGSNIANIGLILGLTCLVVPLKLGSATLRRELPLLILAKLAALLLIADGRLERLEALILLAMLALALAWITRIARQPSQGDPVVIDMQTHVPEGMRLGPALRQLGLGLGMLLAAAQLLVWGGSGLAAAFGVSDLVIGLTIVAIGTSLPELATCVAAALKGHHGIAVGNILGSNLFNLLAVLPLPGLIAPGPLPAGVLERDFPIMIGLGLLLVILARGFTGFGRISRAQGGLLLLIFIAYQGWLLFSA